MYTCTCKYCAHIVFFSRAQGPYWGNYTYYANPPRATVLGVPDRKNAELTLGCRHFSQAFENRASWGQPGSGLGFGFVCLALGLVSCMSESPAASVPCSEGSACSTAVCWLPFLGLVGAGTQTSAASSAVQQPSALPWPPGRAKLKLCYLAACSLASASA